MKGLHGKAYPYLDSISFTLETARFVLSVKHSLCNRSMTRPYST